MLANSESSSLWGTGLWVMVVLTPLAEAFQCLSQWAGLPDLPSGWLFVSRAWCLALMLGFGCSVYLLEASLILSQTALGKEFWHLVLQALWVSYILCIICNRCSSSRLDIRNLGSSWIPSWHRDHGGAACIYFSPSLYEHVLIFSCVACPPSLP